MEINLDGEIVTPFIRTRYNYDADRVSRETGLACSDPTLAQQNFKEECDINTIVERFGITGQLPTNLRVPLNEEFIETMDYQAALNKLIEADAAFMQLPAHVRHEFQNDAGRFVDFVSDEKNVEKCREWGLAMPKAPEKEIPVVRILADSGPGTGSSAA